MMALVIAVSNEKGGVGKTVISIELAQEFMRRGYRVLFIDCDAQVNSTSFYEAAIDNQSTVVDMLCDNVSASQCIQHCSNGDIIAGDPQLIYAEQAIRRDGDEYEHLQSTMENVKDDYDFIVIDTPRGYGIVMQNVLVASDYILVPVDGRNYALDGVVAYTNGIDKMCNKHNPDLVKLGLVTNMHRSNLNSHQRLYRDAGELCEVMNVKNFETKIGLADAVETCIAEKHIPVHKGKNKKVAEQFENLALEVLKEIQKTPKGKNLRIRKIKE